MIPNDEQPYPLPVGWQWCRLGDVTKNQYGYTAKALKNDTLPKMLRITDIQDGAVNWCEVPNCEIDDEQKKKYLLQDNDIVIARTGATTGKSYIVSNPINSVFASYLIRLQLAKPINVRYLYYFLQSDLYWQQISDLSAGIAQPGVNSSKLKRMPFPLPPLNEQQRIVALLDELFTDLDEAKALAQSVVDGSKLRRAAIPHKAFTGELTKLWRDEHGSTLDSWQRCLLGDVCQINPPKISTRDLSDDLEVSFVPMVAVSDVRGEITAPQRKSLREVKSGFTNFTEGDVLFAKITPCMENGKVALVGELVNHIGYGSTEFFVLRCGEKIFKRFVYHLVRWQIFRNEAKSVMAGAVGQQRVPKRFLTGYRLNLPPLEEQKEIVRLLDDLLGREQKTKDLALKTIERVELMKKSILARAFRGELGINKNLRNI